MGIEVRTRARGLGQISMTRQCVGCDAKVLGGPCERNAGSVKLGLRHGLLVEVSFAEDQEVACCVVVGRSVARDLGAPQFVDVAIAVNGDVIRDVDPSLLVLVVALILAQATRGVAVVAQDDGFVVEGHAGDGVVPPAGECRSGAPGIAA